MQMLTIGELSKRSGVTVRALRYYESKGLITPVRSESRQRLYRFRDVLRLQQIQMLKRTGFSLKQIEDMIGTTGWDARKVLSVQKDLLEKQQAHVSQSLTLVTDALKALEADAGTDLSTLCNIIKMGDDAMSAEKWQKAWDKFYTPEEQEKWKAAKEAIPADVVAENQRRWPAVIARAEELAAAGADPAGEAAQALLREWQALLEPFMDMDPTMLQGVNRMYENMGDWPSDGPQSPFSPEVWAFIKSVKAASA